MSLNKENKPKQTRINLESPHGSNLKTASSPLSELSSMFVHVNCYISYIFLYISKIICYFLERTL